MKNKKNKLIIGGLFFTTLMAIGIVFNTPTLKAENPALNSDEFTISDRINTSEKELKILEENTNQEIEALISLDGQHEVEIAKAISTETGIEIEAMYHAYTYEDEVISGGFILEEDQTIEDAVVKYEDDLKTMLVNQIENYEEEVSLKERSLILEQNPNAEKAQEEQRSVEAKKELIHVFKERLNELNNDGLKIYGLKVKGTGENLLKLKSQEEVRLVEKVTGDNENWKPINTVTSEVQN
ncbi:hypothetical protein J45TS6_25090 [Paenibacillus sp. J45TS6]|uniref:Uncharacterized protein n=1 Tax=Paenibacillus polygoni TaxID=3050112 RepID=A0ABY8X5G3_9BACL|nr:MULTISPECIES: hypothetical protein [Paenibacillus]WIV20293.1 hypothetical protein QPK24_06255 [Paenibacillus polygoni]GIP44050.1 hypothetical protein J45TS6_25090 [Paenibacillus sp. J45TS6]